MRGFNLSPCLVSLIQLSVSSPHLTVVVGLQICGHYKVPESFWHLIKISKPLPAPRRELKSLVLVNQEAPHQKSFCKLYF